MNFEKLELGLVENETDTAYTDLITLQSQFFNLVPSKSLDFSTVGLGLLADVENEQGDPGIIPNKQKKLLKLTLKNPLVENFPIKFEYQLSYLKCLINQLEASGLEVEEELYTTYCDLLSLSKSNPSTHYRHFMLDTSESVIVKESSCIISQGTTGLCSWQASQALANWCISHQDFFLNKHVLELGSGVGLTGLTVGLRCNPASYWFSDCHPAVLELLQFNVSLNIDLISSKISKPGCSNIKVTSIGEEDHVFDKRVLLSGQLKRTKVKVLDLPWEDIPKSSISLITNPDIILAADVVYDNSSFPPLINALKHLLESKLPSECLVLLAVTVRNPQTLKQFLSHVEVEGLTICEDKIGKPSPLAYSTEVPIRLYRITRTS